MFNLFGLSGREFTGTLEQLRQLPAVAAVARTRQVAGLAHDPAWQPGAQLPAAASEAGTALRRQLQGGYGQATEPAGRQPLRTVAEVMSRPPRVLPHTATVREAWQFLARHRIRQAPVASAQGQLVGLIAGAELLPPGALDAQDTDPQAWRERLARPVATLMWSPVPSALPHTLLRDLAALLLHTGLPGVPVTGDDGQLLGFVSRSDLLRALAHDPPLDLWG